MICFSSSNKHRPSGNTPHRQRLRPVLTLSQQPSALHKCHLSPTGEEIGRLKSYTRKRGWHIWAAFLTTFLIPNGWGFSTPTINSPTLRTLNGWMCVYWLNSILTPYLEQHQTPQLRDSVPRALPLQTYSVQPSFAKQKAWEEVLPCFWPLNSGFNHLREWLRELRKALYYYLLLIKDATQEQPLEEMHRAGCRGECTIALSH